MNEKIKSIFTEQQIADLYSAAVSAEVNDEAGDAASASSFELFDQLEATGGAAHTIRVLIDRVRAAERAMNPTTAADDIVWWKQEAEDCKARLLELAKENEDLRRQLDEANLPIGKDAEKLVLTMPSKLHPDSKQLVLDTAGAMAATLLKAQVKYGFDNGWKVPPESASGDDGRHFWSRDECLAAFFNHLGKGDPLDCINYLAFMRANGWETELPKPVELSVWYGSMPESNGKTNWTAILHRKGECLSTGITIDRSEYPDRVRYEADRMRHLIGELVQEPDILAYDADKHSGYVAPKSEHLQRAEKLAEDTAKLAERVGGSTCEWKSDDSDHSWEGQCGTKWQFFDDGPTENGMKFCPGCGKPVLVTIPDE